MPVDHFYFHPLTLAYEFGPRHPLRPERLRRAMILFEEVLGIQPVLPELASEIDILRAHDQEYIDTVKRFSAGERDFADEDFNIGPGDCPPFDGMFEASAAYVGAAVAAANALNAGAMRGYNIAGGLHHARRRQAAGFCIFNDAVVAIRILREKFDRVAYVDIDVHHGEGVQFAFDDDPSVLTCSIHQDGRTLFPGTGGVLDVGPSGAAVNVPLAPGTSGDVWLRAFEQTILPAIDQFQPQALVVQCGTDAHYLDPLARINCLAQDWLRLIHHLHHLRLPTVVLGGGGYCLTTVPRMWLAAVATFADQYCPERLPEPFASDWEMPLMLDSPDAAPRGLEAEFAEKVIQQVQNLILPNLPR